MDNAARDEPSQLCKPGRECLRCRYSDCRNQNARRTTRGDYDDKLLGIEKNLERAGKAEEYIEEEEKSCLTSQA